MSAGRTAQAFPPAQCRRCALCHVAAAALHGTGIGPLLQEVAFLLSQAFVHLMGSPILSCTGFRIQDPVQLRRDQEPPQRKGAATSPVVALDLCLQNHGRRSEVAQAGALRSGDKALDAASRVQLAQSLAARVPLAQRRLGACAPKPTVLLASAWGCQL